VNLQEFYDSLDLKEIRGFVEDNREEDLHLDFKMVSSLPFTRDDRKNFAKALSGFANSSGGIVVWGIDARKNDEGVDSASEEKPIAKLSKLISDLNSFTGEFVNPIVEGVQHKSISIEDDSGFAVSLIPESVSGPHMAKGGEDRYYIEKWRQFLPYGTLRYRGYVWTEGTTCS
jgi:predicted HTH transcriptional regulator